MVTYENLIIVVTVKNGKIVAYNIPCDKAIIEAFWNWYHKAKHGKFESVKKECEG